MAADRRRCAMAAALLLAAAPALAAEPQTDAWPWSSVGRIMVNGKGPCSGVLVEPQLVLTVGHCVARREPWRPRNAERIRFLLDDVEHEVARVRLNEASPFRADGELGDVSRDVAWLILAEGAAAKPVPYGGAEAMRRAFVLEDPVFKVGFAGKERQLNVACSIVGVAESGDAFAFRCPGGTGAGASGSAVLVRTETGYEVRMSVE